MRNLARRAAGIGAWTLASRILGLLRDRLFAGAMGGSLVLDCFLVAFALPNLVRNLFGDGALSAAFIPRYVQERARDAAAAEAFAGAVLTRLALGLSAVAALGMVVAAGLAWGGAGRTALIATLAIPQLPFLVFVCVGAIAGGVLNARGVFWAPAAAPVLLNCCLIATAWLDPEAEARWLPYAVLAAGIIQLALLLLVLRRHGGLPPLHLRSTPEVAELRRASLPNLIASGVFQINAFLDSVIALVFVPGSGAVAFLYFGNRLVQFPMALIGHGVTTAAYPELARAAAGADGWQAMGEGLRRGLSLTAFWLLPAAAGLIVCADPLVRAVYQIGSFDADAVARTVLITELLGLGLLPIGLSKLLMRAFHARRDQATPLKISLATIGLNLGLNVALVLTPLREAGLALATAIASTAGCIAYVVILQRRGTGRLFDLRALRRPILATLAMSAAVVVLLRYWPQPAGVHATMPAVLRLTAAVAVGIGIYLAIAGIGWWRRSVPATPQSEPSARNKP